MFKTLVKFRDGTFGIRKWQSFTWFFLGEGGNKWWWFPEYVRKYCHMSLERAQCLFTRVVEQDKHDIGTSFKIDCPTTERPYE